MATVEQCETQTSGLSSISTLKLFDSFNTSRDDEKDSDEESFHLPLLDCDDDLETKKKDSLPNEVDKELSCETEDEILSKFETSGTPDIDPKIEEDRILEEIDSLLEKKLEEHDDADSHSDEKSTNNSNSKEDSNIEKEADTDGSVSKPSDILDNTAQTSELNSTVVETVASHSNTIQSTSDTAENIKFSLEEGLEREGNKENLDKISEDIKFPLEEQELLKEDDDIQEKCVEGNKQKVDVEESEKQDDIGKETDIVNEIKSNDFSEADNAINKLNIEETEMITDEENLEKDNVAINEEKISQTEETCTNMENIENKLTENNDLPSSICVEAMEVDRQEEEEEVTKQDTCKDRIIIPKDVATEGVDSKQEISTGISENSNQNEPSDNKILKGQITETNKESELESEKPEELSALSNGNVQNTDTDKCENSNDSVKSQNLDCDDLLDISIIRDADEDNASAIEENAQDAQTSEKSDNDNDDADESSDKADNELDESEMDQDDKDDHMDFDDESNNLCEPDNLMTLSENICDGDSKDNAEVTDSEKESQDNKLKEKSDITPIELSAENTTNVENNFKPKITDGNDDEGKKGTQESQNEDLTNCSAKRSLSESDIETPNKKIKLSEEPKPEEKTPVQKNIKINTLVSFEKYMQNKKIKDKLTRSDLEQFCLQKICEVIVHKSDVGELHQTIKKQEQIIENLRKDLQQLTKQTRDLDIVNKKLMNELRTQNGTRKPLVPLKITRSVGLQVKLNLSNEAINRRKGPIVTTSRTPTNNSTPARPRTITPANANVVRQVAASPRKAPAATPLLSQALQNRQQVSTVNTVTKRPPIRPKPAEPQKPANSGVIDLTDEDDKAAKGLVGNTVKTINKTIQLSHGKAINIIPTKTNSNQSKTVAVGQVKTTNAGSKVGTPSRTVSTLPQGVRLTPTQVKNGSIAIPASVVTSNSGTTQFMYVVQPGSVVTSTAGGAQKAVLLNFQPTNGLLSSTLNGSAVSVLPSKTSNTVKLKTVGPCKHPAPLPNPPPATVNTSLKPLLPKPHLSIRKTDTGIILQWRMPYNLDIYEAIASYQLFAYQETNAPPNTDMWRKVGDVKALALPMACTLTQFADKNKYYFAVRSIDVHKRIGAFSDPEEISL